LFTALKRFIADSVFNTEMKLAIPNCPYAELNEREFYFFLENLKRSGFSEEFDKQVTKACKKRLYSFLHDEISHQKLPKPSSLISSLLTGRI
jgi:hypothetical protein